MRLNWIRTLAAGLLVSAIAPSWAQDNFPNRSLRIVVPTSPGSGSDTVGRFFAEQLSVVLGSPWWLRTVRVATG
jgi:tripartite-type tricarboxylate transporter receptor subunit TctC